MGQTCGVADPSQWMRMFGVDIDSRDTAELIRAAERISPERIKEFYPRLKQLFGAAPQANVVNERSIRLYLALRKSLNGRILISIPFSRFRAWETIIPQHASRRA